MVETFSSVQDEGPRLGDSRDQPHTVVKAMLEVPFRVEELQFSNLELENV